MNVYLFDIIFNWISIFFISFISLFGSYSEKEIVVNNENKNKSLNLITEIVNYETVIKYNNKKPSGEKTVITPGETGYKVSNIENGTVISNKQPVNEVVEIGTYINYNLSYNNNLTSLRTIESFRGKMTSYGGDCYGCSGTVAYVKHNLLTDGFYYNDKTYGKMRILAASRSKFPAGTIVELVISPSESIYGIVLDTGGDMEKAYKNGTIWMDLAFSTQKEAANFGTRYNVTYNIKRYGF